ncbi:magnesium chelatase subunit D [Piscinibacter sakaiensis]|uniref:Protoporphyrin IX Mg-chelatase, subunit D n=1 Tax=Piscinibacter sakaiensis TaxID=1547922 RepID=A0A0K8NWT5_PISS1|nr:magnesium chelatase subunit D [Piscinibacter sakaiensis]GAP34400.1 protoporphyrin IX Mg-chelatase, subunit D [Piscinibacter sakaiensis]
MTPAAAERDADQAAAAEARRAAAVLAIDPAGLGGAVLRGPAGPARAQWLQGLEAACGAPLRKLPASVDDATLLGGLDLVGTLAAGRPVARPGLLAEADGGLLCVPMAERLPPGLAARLAAVLDTGEVPDPAGGPPRPARLAIVACDEGLDEDERLPAALAERLALHLRLPARGLPAPPSPPDVAAARARWPAVVPDEGLLPALCSAAARLGIDSLRVPWLALRVARASAALDGRPVAGPEDAAWAARWVLAPRARVRPAEPPPADPPPEATPDAPPPAEPPPAQDAAAPPPADRAAGPAAQDEAPPPGLPETLPEQVLEAALSALPPGQLLALAAGAAGRAPASRGRHGAEAASARRGRPVGARRGRPRDGERLDLLATLRAAAPWQTLRRRERGREGLQWRLDDLHRRRHRERRETTTIFAVDASGSAALHRLGEAKGAVELLLADCYVRRDRVALLAFRGSTAELLLPPTRSLPRARRCLAALPGGGGTPLAAGLDAARALALPLLRRGVSPTLVLLTDGRANVARDGSPGREAGQRDALAAARALRADGLAALLIDTSPRPQPTARELADAMGARYLALPHADARALSQAVGASLG